MSYRISVDTGGTFTDVVVTDQQGRFTVGKALVLNCIAVLAKMTETAVALNRLDGTGASRASTFQKPSAKALQEFLDH